MEKIKNLETSGYNNFETILGSISEKDSYIIDIIFSLG
jgi:hypothetical protein